MEFWETVGAVVIGAFIFHVLNIGLGILWGLLFGK